MPYTKEEHEKVASKMQRDSKGHFVHAEQPRPREPAGNLVEKFIEDHTSYHKTQDAILDVHVGNPLHKIVELLQEIKKQKAFSFTLKGSLGIMGVALALSVFGIFGGGKILCDKGVQSQIGVIKTLNIYDSDSSTIPVLSLFLNYFNPKTPHYKTILVKTDETVISVLGINNQTIQQWNNNYVIATGNYDSCSQALTVSNPDGIEIYPR